MKANGLTEWAERFFFFTLCPKPDKPIFGSLWLTGFLYRLTAKIAKRFHRINCERCRGVGDAVKSCDNCVHFGTDEDEWPCRYCCGWRSYWEPNNGITVVTTRQKERTVNALVVCLCGSTRFRSDIAEANRAATMAGKIVIAPGVFGHSGDPLTNEDKARLDRLHFEKIDMADEVLVVNPGGYIGESTRREIEYATMTGKPVAYTHNAELQRATTR
jgi:hypothetical protein